MTHCACMHVAAGAPVAHISALFAVCVPAEGAILCTFLPPPPSLSCLPRLRPYHVACAYRLQGGRTCRCNRSELQEAGDPVAAAAAAAVTVASGSSRSSSRAGGCGGVTVREVPRGAATAATVFPPARPSLPDEPCSATLRASNADSHSPPLWR
jgi:hypothetical protein